MKNAKKPSGTFIVLAVLTLVFGVFALVLSLDMLFAMDKTSVAMGWGFFGMAILPMNIVGIFGVRSMLKSETAILRGFRYFAWFDIWLNVVALLVFCCVSIVVV